MPLTTEHTTCRACDSHSLTSILNLGTPVLSDFMRPEDPDPERVPLDCVVCQDCSLVQLRHATDPQVLYVKNYWYRSSVNETMKAELADVVQKATLMVGGIDPRETAMDIGANDGYLLSCYVSPSGTPDRIAYEPALTLYDVLHVHADVLIPRCFPLGIDELGSTRKRGVKIMSSIAVFNHVDDPRKFVQAVDEILATDGVWVMQVQDLAQQIQTTAYDCIGHEHVTYDSLKTFQALLDPFDLQVVLAERRAINGGSLRCYVRRRHQPVWRDAVTALEQAEAWLDYEALTRFAARAQHHRTQLRGTIDHFRKQGAAVDLYACSTKSSTLLQHCGIDASQIRFGVERTPEKVGRVTSGTRIPIVSEEMWRADPAPVCVLGAYQFKTAFLAREAAYLASGGRFLVPLPTAEIVEQASGAA